MSIENVSKFNDSKDLYNYFVYKALFKDGSRESDIANNLTNLTPKDKYSSIYHTSSDSTIREHKNKLTPYD